MVARGTALRELDDRRILPLESKTSAGARLRTRLSHPDPNLLTDLRLTSTPRGVLRLTDISYSVLLALLILRGRPNGV